MTHKSAKLSADMFPELSPFERHKLFLEGLRKQPLTQSVNLELIKAYFPKK